MELGRHPDILEKWEARNTAQTHFIMWPPSNGFCLFFFNVAFLFIQGEEGGGRGHRNEAGDQLWGSGKTGLPLSGVYFGVWKVTMALFKKLPMLWIHSTTHAIIGAFDSWVRKFPNGSVTELPPLLDSVCLLLNVSSLWPAHRCWRRLWGSTRQRQAHPGKYQKTLSLTGSVFLKDALFS